MMLKRRFLLSFAISGLLLVGGNGCGRSETGLLTFVPSDSAAILIVNWTSVKKDSELRSIIKSVEFEAQMRRLGTESEAIDEVVAFGASSSRAALLMRGKFDRQKIINHLESTGWSESAHDGPKMYVNASDFVSLPTRGVIIGGPREGVLAALQTAKDSRENINSAAAFRNIKDEMPAGKSPIMGFLIAPDGTLEMADAALSVTAGAMSLFGIGEIGAILKKLNVASGAGFSIARGATSQKCAVNFCVVMRDEQTATIAAGALSVMKNLSTFVGNADDKENLRNFSVTRRKKVLSIKMEIPSEALMPPDTR
ncbi:MAG: hypothetical protein ACKVQW_15615 [Pyrinomonadaceae bacterium]